VPRRVLLVDDDIAEISAVKRVLLREGAQTHLATNATDALAALATARPVLLLIAPACENGEGLQLARRLAADAATRDLPLILLGAPEEEAPGTVMKRPIDPGLLAEEVRRFLQPGARGTAVQPSPRAPSPPPPPATAPAPALTPVEPAPRTQAAAPAPPAPASDAAPATAPATAEVRRQAAEALRARAEELRRAGSEERARREGEARRRREEEIELEERGRIEAEAEARTRAEDDARRALATSEAEEALRQLAEEVGEAAPTAAPEPIATPVPVPKPARAAARALAATPPEPPLERAEPEQPLPEEYASLPPLELSPPAAPLPPLDLEPASAAPAAPEPEPEPEPPPPLPPAPASAPPPPAPPPAPLSTPPAPRFTPVPVRASAPSVAAAVAAREEAKRRASAARARRAPEPPAPEPLPPPRAAPALPPPPTPPPPPEPEGPPVPSELGAGSLDRLSAAWLLARAARARLGGRLDFAGSAPRSLYWEEGRIVGATSGAPAERVEEVAQRLGLITREQHRQASPACAGLPSRRAAMALLDAGFLRPEELTGLVRRRTEEVVFALFAEPGATWRHAHARVPPDERTALDRGAPALAVEGVRRRWGAERLERLLGGPATLLTPALGGPAREELGLGREERRLLELADGLRSLDEIAADSPLDPLSTRQVLGALVEVGTLAVRIRSEPLTARPSSAIDLARLAEKLDQVRRADYFTILGVSRAATPYELRTSAERLLQELDAPRWALIDEPGLTERIAEVRRVVAEAREVLLDPELRASYVEGLE